MPLRAHTSASKHLRAPGQLSRPAPLGLFVDCHNHRKTRGRPCEGSLTELSCYAVDIPAPHDSYVMSHGRVLTSFPATTKITAEDGTARYGEAGKLGSNYLDGFPGSTHETVRLLASWVLACDVFAPGVLVEHAAWTGS